MEKNKELQLFVLLGLRKVRGRQFTRGVSPKQINNMLGKQIRARQLTNKECTLMPIHVTKITLRFMRALRQKYIDRHPAASMTNNPPL